MFRASPRGEHAPAPVRPPQRVPTPRLPARGACTCAGSPTTACTDAAPPARGVCNRAGPPTTACTDAAPPREGSVHLRRSAHHSVYRRRASPRGECATAPVRLSKVYRRRASPRGERAPAPVRPPQRVPAPRLPARGACNRAGPPTKACADAAPPREGIVHLRRSAYQSVCRRRASPRGERAPAPVRPPKRVPAPRLPRGSVHLRRTTERVPGARLHRAECAQNAPR